MKYCSECGSTVSRQWNLAEKRDRVVCSVCSKIFYENPRVIVCSIVHCGDKVLMCRRAEEPMAGLWALPSGFLECGERLEEGAARETFEETGLVLDPDMLELCAVVNMTDLKQVAVAFRIQLADMPQVIPGPECLDVAFLAEYEVPVGEFAWRGSTGSAPEKFTLELKSRNFAIHMATLGCERSPRYRSRRYLISSVIADP